MLQLQKKVDESLAGRVDRVVVQLTRLSRAQVTGLFDAGCVTVNGQPCEQTFRRVTAGDVVEVQYDPRKRYKPKPPPWRDPAFKLVFEDEHVLVVDKAPNVQTVPSENRPEKSLIEALRRYVRREKRKGEAYVVHRLDLGTSGLLVFAKTQAAAERLQKDFEAHKPRREYVAVVAGHVLDDEGTFESHLATGPDLTRYSTKNPEAGQHAVTHYKVEGRATFVQGIRPALTLVRCRLETGRRNQIRVHFAEAGHPLLGDNRYFFRSPAKYRRPVLRELWPHKRIALHACVLEFTHPASGQSMRFESPVPPELTRPFLRRGQSPFPRRASKRGTDPTS